MEAFMEDGMVVATHITETHIIVIETFPTATAEEMDTLQIILQELADIAAVLTPLPDIAPLEEVAPQAPTLQMELDVPLQ